MVLWIFSLWGVRSLVPRPSLSNKLQNIMSAELPWSTKIRWTSYPAILAAITKGSLSLTCSCGKSLSEKDKTGFFTWVICEHESLVSRVRLLSTNPFQLIPLAITCITPLCGNPWLHLGLRDLFRVSSIGCRLACGDLCRRSRGLGLYLRPLLSLDS